MNNRGTEKRSIFLIKGEFNIESKFGGGISREGINRADHWFCNRSASGIGSGFLESAYQACLAREFALRELRYEQEVPLPVEYKGAKVDCGYRLDFQVEGKVILELKTVSDLLPVHEAQLPTYLRLTGTRVGLLINFNVPVLKSGIKRMIL